MERAPPCGDAQADPAGVGNRLTFMADRQFYHVMGPIMCH